MRKCKIVVYNYHSGGSILHPLSDKQDPKRWEVEAWCVGGEEGIFAVFPHPDNPNLTVYAQGDDGHWWFAGLHANAWNEDIVKAFVAYMGVPVITSSQTLKKTFDTEEGV